MAEEKMVKGFVVQARAAIDDPSGNLQRELERRLLAQVRKAGDASALSLKSMRELDLLAFLMTAPPSPLDRLPSTEAFKPLVEWHQALDRKLQPLLFPGETLNDVTVFASEVLDRPINYLRHQIAAVLRDEHQSGLCDGHHRERARALVRAVADIIASQLSIVERFRSCAPHGYGKQDVHLMLNLQLLQFIARTVPISLINLGLLSRECEKEDPEIAQAFADNHSWIASASDALCRNQFELCQATTSDHTRALRPDLSGAAQVLARDCAAFLAELDLSLEELKACGTPAGLLDALEQELEVIGRCIEVMQVGLLGAVARRAAQGRTGPSAGSFTLLPYPARPVRREHLRSDEGEESRPERAGNSALEGTALAAAGKARPKRKRRRPSASVSKPSDGSSPLLGEGSLREAVVVTASTVHDRLAASMSYADAMVSQLEHKTCVMCVTPRHVMDYLQPVFDELTECQAVLLAMGRGVQPASTGAATGDVAAVAHAVAEALRQLDAKRRDLLARQDSLRKQQLAAVFVKRPLYEGLLQLAKEDGLRVRKREHRARLADPDQDGGPLRGLQEYLDVYQLFTAREDFAELHVHFDAQDKVLACHLKTAAQAGQTGGGVHRGRVNLHLVESLIGLVNGLPHAPAVRAAAPAT